ncbi:hypothetical protein BDR05DRAFT_1005710 [Suillus weaverae]|nr:hypothetical protein BDR05DRAFT_1005710 [Suillus weaverae]
MPELSAATLVSESLGEIVQIAQSQPSFVEEKSFVLLCEMWKSFAKRSNNLRTLDRITDLTGSGSSSCSLTKADSLANNLKLLALWRKGADDNDAPTDEAMLRKRIQERGWDSIDKYSILWAQANLSHDYYSSERLAQLRTSGSTRESEGCKSHERESTPKLGAPAGTGPPICRPPARLILADTPSLQLLAPAEQTLRLQL